MPTPIPADRLPRLKKALGKYKPGEMESQQQLAKIYGVAPARMVTLIHNRFGKDFPPAQRRDDKTHWYEAIPALEAMIAYVQGKGALKRASAARAAAVLAGRDPAEAAPAGGDPSNPAWPEGLLTPTEMDRLASAQTRIWRLKKEQGLYVLRTDVEDLVRRYYSLVTQRIMGIPSVIDPNGSLPPAIRAALQKECREINLALVKQVEGMIGPAPDVPDEEGIGDADGGDGGTSGAAGRARDHNPRRRPRRRKGDMAPAA